jgi:hypothetical protein
MTADCSPTSKELREQVECKLLETALSAIEKLRESIDTGESMRSDDEMRACLAALKLTPAVMKPRRAPGETKPPEPPKPRPSIINPNLTPDQVAERVRKLDACYEKARAKYLKEREERLARERAAEAQSPARQEARQS